MATADKTTSDSNSELVDVASPPQSKPASPRAPRRKHRARAEKTVEAEERPREAQSATLDCLSRLESQSVDVKNGECEGDKKSVKVKTDCHKMKPESPRSKLRCATEGELRRQRVIDQLQLDNATLKKSLESERSAFREHRAQHEAESRRERAEARRREASLEGQLRSALRGGPAALTTTPGDNATAAALEATKAANKCLQQKLQVLTEADKRKAGELRAQHEAHVHQLQQLEKRARAQTVQLLEELKAKERQLSQVAGRNAIKGLRTVQSGHGLQATIKGHSKMGVAEQLHLMEGQISRLESELQRRDDIIQSLKNTKSKREKQLDSQQFGKDNILKDTISDVDSAVSSGPNSLSPQPSPDLWFQSRETSLGNVEEGLLETARRQIHELEMALSISKAGHQSAQLRATQLEEQLQDLREHADLLEFRCLELEDTSEKRNSLEEMTDCDSGCTSPEVCLKNSASPPLRRSDSGYKSPTNRPSSPRGKTHRVLRTPTISVSENSFTQHIDNSTNNLEPLNVEHIESVLNEQHQSNDIRDRLERILLKTPSEEDRLCLEQVLHLLWNLQSLSSSFTEDDFSGGKSKKTFDIDCIKSDIEHNKASKIIATISPYSQKSFHDHPSLTKSITNDANLIDIKAESRKLLLGLHESGIFEDSDWENKETQTEWSDFTNQEPAGDLEMEVQRLNQIREQLEKSGAIANKKLNNGLSKTDNLHYDYYQIDKMQHIEKDHKEYYENRIALLESKISIYESSNDVRDKKLAQRLQKEINLQSKVKILETDLKKLREKYVLLEEERCELEEAENDTRLHCQVLQTEFEIQSAKLRDIDEERSCARNEADCYRALVEEYENKSTYLQEQEKELKERIKVMENAVPALVFWNIWKIIDKYPDFDFKAAYKAKFDNLSLGMDSSETLQPEIEAMFEYLSSQNVDTDSLKNIEEHLHSYGENEGVQGKCKVQEEMLRSKMATIEKIVLENSVLCKKQEEAAANRIKALEDELQAIRGNPNQANTSTGKNCDDKCKLKLQALFDKETELKERIKALENREVVLLMTLTQADEMWAGVENKYKQQIKVHEDNEVNLKEQMNESESEKNKWKSKCEPLEQKICELEESELKFETGYKKLSQENKELLSKITILEDQLSILKTELQHSKEQIKNMEDRHKNELMFQKKKVGVAQEELQVQKKQQIDGDEAHNSKLSSIRKQLSKTSKELQELEVTNGELKEEVETLEKEVQKLSQELSRRHSENEENIKSLLEELMSKSKEADVLKKELSEYQRLPSAREELEQLCEMIPKTIEPMSVSPELDIDLDRKSFDNEITAPEPKTTEKTSNELGVTDANESDKMHAVSEHAVNREKPALPKRKPKLSLENSKFKIEDQKLRLLKSKPSEKTSAEEGVISQMKNESQINTKDSLNTSDDTNSNNSDSFSDQCMLQDCNKKGTNILTMEEAYTINSNIIKALKEITDCEKCGKKATNLLQDSLSILQKTLGNSEDTTNINGSKVDENKHLPWKPKPFQSITPTTFTMPTIGIINVKKQPSTISNDANKNTENSIPMDAAKPNEPKINTKITSKISSDVIANNLSVKETLGPHQKQIPSKGMGNFVFDRVSKLLTGITPSNPSDFPSSPSITENNKLINKNVYIYNL